jgi:TolA-binding protein
MRHVVAVMLVLACLRLWAAGEHEPGASVPSAVGAQVAALLPAEPAATAAQRLYAKITDVRLRGDCRAAIDGFRLFLELHGRDALAAYAQYWRGECEWQLGRYADAVASFDGVLNRTPLPSTLASEALMRKGLAYARLGDTGRSRRTLELVVAQFPDSDAAHNARRMLLTAARQS